MKQKRKYNFFSLIAVTVIYAANWIDYERVWSLTAYAAMTECVNYARCFVNFAHFHCVCLSTYLIKHYLCVLSTRHTRRLHQRTRLIKNCRSMRNSQINEQFCDNFSVNRLKHDNELIRLVPHSGLLVSLNCVKAIKRSLLVERERLARVTHEWEIASRGSSIQAHIQISIVNSYF